MTAPETAALPVTRRGWREFDLRHALRLVSYVQAHLRADSGKPMTDLVSTFRSIVGPRHVLVGERATRRYRKGYRYGDGPVLAVVRPGTLVEQWRVLEACVAAGVAII